MATKAEVGTVLHVLIDAYPSIPLGPNTLALYRDELADLDIALLHRAAREHIRTSRFFPTIAELRERVAGFAPPQPTAPLLPMFVAPRELTDEERCASVKAGRKVSELVARLCARTKMPMATETELQAEGRKE